MTKKLVSYDDIQEALRLTAEAAEKRDNVVTIPTTHGPYKMDFKPLALAVVESFAASLKQVSIEQRRPFRGQAYADMAITHTERAAQLLSVARGTNDAKQRQDALRDALEHLDEARRMTAVCGVKVNEELAREPGKLVRLGADDFDVKTTVPKL